MKSGKDSVDCEGQAIGKPDLIVDSFPSSTGDNRGKSRIEVRHESLVQGMSSANRKQNLRPLNFRTARHPTGSKE
jgi:hypothetical protein